MSTPTPPEVPPWVTAMSGLAPFAAVIPNPLIAAAAGVLLQYGPEALAALIKLIHTPNPSHDDWLALLKSVDSKTYDDYIAEAKAAAGKV